MILLIVFINRFIKGRAGESLTVMIFGSLGTVEENTRLVRGTEITNLLRQYCQQQNDGRCKVVKLLQGNIVDQQAPCSLVHCQYDL